MIKLNIEQIITCHSGLQALDSYDKVISANGNESIVKTSYKFSGKTRMKIARILGALDSEFSAFNKTRTELIKQISGDESIPADNKEMQLEFIKEIQSISNEEHEFDFSLLSYDDLALDDNPISGSTLTAIRFVIKD